ncbi:hypothetical protein MKY96_33800 [Paenibacillus sp. FSL R7-0302]
MFSARFWIGIFANVLITMILIVIIKKLSAKWNIPFLAAVSAEV